MSKWATEQEALCNFREQTVAFGEGGISEPVNYHPRVFEARVIVGGSLKILEWDLGLAAAELELRINRVLDKLNLNC